VEPPLETPAETREAPEEVPAQRVDPAVRVAELEREAQELNEAGRHADAIARLEEASALAPDDPELLFRLGGTYGFANDYFAAVRTLERARALAPDDFRTHGALGIAYARLGRLDDAVAEFREVARIRPQEPEPHLWLGMIGYESKDYALCAEGFGRFVELIDATDPSARKDLEQRHYREAGERAAFCRARLAEGS
jgi:Flp pilus assembly protein TadD